jgi:hypothetical protein
MEHRTTGGEYGMKRMLLAIVCALALVFSGCTDINQTNSFTELPTPAQTEQPQITAPPVQPDQMPTLAPNGTPTPPPPPPSVSPAPDESPAIPGING